MKGTNDSDQEAVISLLKSRGGTLVRSKRHNVWRLPNGQTFAFPQTGSDHRGWKNALSDVRRRLGIISPAKIQKDFEHQRRDHQPPSKPTPQTFLSSLPEREEPIKPAVRVLPEQEREFYTLAGQVPIVRSHRGGGPRSGARTGEAYTYSQEILSEANNVLRLYGQAAAQDYLDGVKNGSTPQSRKEETVTDYITEPAQDLRIVKGGTIEGQFEEALKRVNEYKHKEREAQEESMRWQSVANSLRHALSLVNATRSELRELQRGTEPHITTPAQQPSSDKKTRISASPHKPHGFWRNVIRETVITSPEKMNRDDLKRELHKAQPDVSEGSVYQAIRQALDNGWLIPDEHGLLEYIPRKEEVTA